MESKKAKKIIKNLRSIDLSNSSAFVVDKMGNTLFFLKIKKLKLKIYVINNALLDLEHELTWNYLFKTANRFLMNPGFFDFKDSNSNNLTRIEGIEVFHETPNCSEYRWVEEYKRYNRNSFARS